MARNEEKAMAMLNRWWRQKQELHKKDKEMPKGKRQIFQIDNINECERWRNSLLREVSKKVTKIQNPGLGENIIRDLNDEINNLIKQIRIFEERILELGGTNYKSVLNSITNLEGAELPGFGGYKYFGAAKDLPGVKELFQKEIPEAPQKPLVEIYKSVDFELYHGRKYYNYDEMIKQEKEYEEKARFNELKSWQAQRKELIDHKLNGKINPTNEEMLHIMEEEANADLAESSEDEEPDKIRQEQEEAKLAELNAKKKLLMQSYLDLLQDDAKEENQ